MVRPMASWSWIDGYSIVPDQIHQSAVWLVGCCQACYDSSRALHIPLVNMSRISLACDAGRRLRSRSSLRWSCSWPCCGKVKDHSRRNWHNQPRPIGWPLPNSLAYVYPPTSSFYPLLLFTFAPRRAELLAAPAILAACGVGIP